MRKKLGFSISLCLIFNTLTAQSQEKSFFNRFFVDKTMRVDYYHTGTKAQETISLDKIYEEGKWPGSKINLIDTLNLGDYLFKVYDVTTNLLIYSRGYISQGMYRPAADLSDVHPQSRRLRSCVSSGH